MEVIVKERLQTLDKIQILIDPLTETVTEPVALLTTAVTLSVQNLDAVPGVVISDSETASGSIIKKYKSETE